MSQHTSHNVIYRVDLGAKYRMSDTGRVLGVPINFDNITTILNDKLGSFPRDAIICLSPFHQPQPKALETTPHTEVGVLKQKKEKGTGGLIRHDLYASIYASDRLLDQEGNIAFAANLLGSEAKLRTLCETSTLHNSVIMYDLVLNHLGSTSSQLQELKQAFHQQYPEEQLSKVNEPFVDVESFNYNNPHVRSFVFEQLHKPLLDKLISTGVKGFRIDAAGYVNLEYQKMISNYLNTQFSARKQKYEILAEYLHSSNPDLTQQGCFDAWNKDNSTVNITTSAFLGKKINEGVMKDGMPQWTVDTLHEFQHNTSGMIGNHDELNLTTKAASLVASQSLQNCGDTRIIRDDQGGLDDQRDKERFNGDRRQGGLNLDTTHILTIENQMNLLNKTLKEGEFAGFGKVNKRKLEEIIRAKSIDIAHEQIETNRQIMVCVGPVGDLEGVIGANSVFTRVGDTTRTLRVFAEDSALSVAEEVKSMINHKKQNTTIKPGQWIEKVMIFDKTDPHSKFASIFIKHKTDACYDGKDQIEISYACTLPSFKFDEHIASQIKEVIAARYPNKTTQNIDTAFSSAKLYNAIPFGSYTTLQHTRDLAEPISSKLKKHDSEGNIKCPKLDRSISVR